MPNSPPFPVFVMRCRRSRRGGNCSWRRVRRKRHWSERSAERGGALGSSAGADRAALPEVRSEGWPSAAAAGDMSRARNRSGGSISRRLAAGVFPAELVCALRSDGRRDALRQRGDAPLFRDRAGRRPHPRCDHDPELPPPAGAAWADRGDLRRRERSPCRQGHHPALGHLGRCDDHRRAVLDQEQGRRATPRCRPRRRATTGISA